MRGTTTLIALLLTLSACKSGAEKPAATPPEEQTTEAPPGDDGAKAPQDPAKSQAPIVVTDADAEHRIAPNGKGEVIKFATGKNAFLAKLQMDPGGKVPVHRDPTEEYIYVLQGSGVMTIDGKNYDVGPNTAIYMPANAEVTFQNGDEQLVAIQVFAGPEPAAKYDAWKAKWLS